LARAALEVEGALHKSTSSSGSAPGDENFEAVRGAPPAVSQTAGVEG
jgi:hypothetical protein